MTQAPGVGGGNGPIGELAEERLILRSGPGGSQEDWLALMRHVTGNGSGNPAGTIYQLVQNPEQVLVETIERRSLVPDRPVELWIIVGDLGNGSSDLRLEISLATLETTRPI